MPMGRLPLAFASALCCLRFLAPRITAEACLGLPSVTSTFLGLSPALSVDGKDQTVNVDKSATFQAPGKKKMLQDIVGGLGGLKTGDEATITTDKKDGKDVATKVVTGAKKKK